MTVIAPHWLDAPATRAVMAALAPARPLFVGGCVRDALLGVEAADVDICVAVPPEETARLLRAAGLKAAPTGIDHGTVTAVAEHHGFEVTSLRRDVETDGRRAVVAFTDDVAEDAARRDFTVNALYAQADGAVRDPLGSGLSDLRAGRVRFIGDPHARIAEDYLRVLRFFRFTARFGGAGMDATGLAACAAHVDGLARLSRERVGAEMKAILGLPDPSAALAAMAAAGVLAAVAPGADAADLPALIRAEAAVAAAPDWARRAAIIGAWGADWRLSKAEEKRLSAIAAALAEPRPAAARAHLHGAEAARDAALIEAARQEAPPTPELLSEIARGAAARFPVTAADLIARGATPGPTLGAALATLRGRWIDADFRPGRDALLAGWSLPA
jgi:poly(A) polymerase